MRRRPWTGSGRSSLARTIGVVTVVAMAACTAAAPVRESPADPLPSWNEGPTRDAIVSFVSSVTDSTRPTFVAPADRIAVFDNDGTLWAEQPNYFQLAFAFDRVLATADAHPEWQQQEAFRAIIENDQEALSQLSLHDVVDIVLETHAGMTVDEFGRIVSDWLTAARHPRFDRPYTDIVFQPMLELLDFLRDNGFKTFIVSGGGLDFLRTFAEDVYDIPKDQVVGSSGLTVFEVSDGEARLLKRAEIDFVDDKEGKPVAINRFIGRRPIAAFGNSDGDLAMLQYTAAGDGLRLMALVHHDDAEREWAYDRDSAIGRLDEALDEAHDRDWLVISMRDDWGRVFEFQP